MRKGLFITGFIVLLLGLFDAGAAGLGSVEMLQAPAWLHRDNVRTPLALGMEIAENDRFETGVDARIVLRLGDESLVKIGADADFHVPLIDAGGVSDGVFLAFLDVLKGAFRFTTTELGELREREITAQLRSVTIGIRGTDVWGKVEDGRDFAVLIDGAVSIDHNDQSYALDQPLSLFMAPRDMPAEPIGPVNADDLAVWARETEPQAAKGIRQTTGRVRLHLGTYGDATKARALATRLGEGGYSVEITELEVGGRLWHHVSQAQYATREDALAARQSLQIFGGLSGAWVAGE